MRAFKVGPQRGNNSSPCQSWPRSVPLFQRHFMLSEEDPCWQSTVSYNQLGNRVANKAGNCLTIKADPVPAISQCREVLPIGDFYDPHIWTNIWAPDSLLRLLVILWRAGRSQTTPALIGWARESPFYRPQLWWSQFVLGNQVLLDWRVGVLSKFTDLKQLVCTWMIGG